jgi:CRISPR system Cascade subunit CasB
MEMANQAKQAKAFVKYKISRLSGTQNESAARAMLAKLRRGIGKAPGSMPEIWNVTLDGMPETLSGKGSDPTPGEWAVHTALTLYALHQQGKDLKAQCMSKDGDLLGISLRKLIKNDDDEQRVKRRFDAAATSTSPEEISHHLRGLIQILKAEDIPLDYPALTEDLYWFQFPDARDAVRLRWGRDFYRKRKENDSEKLN